MFVLFSAIFSPGPFLKAAVVNSPVELEVLVSAGGQVVVLENFHKGQYFSHPTRIPQETRD